MLKNSPFYAGIAVDDVTRAKAFYGDTLGVFGVIEIGNGLLALQAANGYSVLLYPKPGHVPAAHTVLNFPVDDIDATVDELAGRGVQFERYDEFPMDEKGIMRGREAGRGPDIAWFKDPSGNVLSVLQES